MRDSIWRHWFCRPFQNFACWEEWYHDKTWRFDAFLQDCCGPSHKTRSFQINSKIQESRRNQYWRPWWRHKTPLFWFPLFDNLLNLQHLISKIYSNWGSLPLRHWFPASRPHPLQHQTRHRQPCSPWVEHLVREKHNILERLNKRKTEQINDDRWKHASWSGVYQ